MRIKFPTAMIDDVYRPFLRIAQRLKGEYCERKDEEAREKNRDIRANRTGNSGKGKFPDSHTT